MQIYLLVGVANVVVGHPFDTVKVKQLILVIYF